MARLIQKGTKKEVPKERRKKKGRKLEATANKAALQVSVRHNDMSSRQQGYQMCPRQLLQAETATSSTTNILYLHLAKGM